MFVQGGLRRDEQGATPGGRVGWVWDRCGVAWEPPDRCEGGVWSSAVTAARTGEVAVWGRITPRIALFRPVRRDIELFQKFSNECYKEIRYGRKSSILSFSKILGQNFF